MNKHVCVCVKVVGRGVGTRDSGMEGRRVALMALQQF